MDLTENVIEWITGDKELTATISQRKFITKIEKLAKQHPTLVKILHTNDDGSIVAHLPLSCLKLSVIIKEMSDEQKEQARDRLRLARERKGE
jgi:hypothetical protein